MKPRLISILVASLFVPGLAYADEQGQTSASVTLGIRYVGPNSNDPSKMNEYRDLRPNGSGFAGLEVQHHGDFNYFNAYGENIGRDDQYLDVKGGRYGSYKYQLYSDQLRHNFGSGPGARSPFFGIGGTTLVGLPNTNVATWNTFDHSYSRRNLGGMFELNATSPWYFRVEANEVKREGINVFAGAKGTSPGNGFVDLPSPIDYTTHNLFGEVGHSTKRSHFMVSVLRTTFDNGNEVLRWQNDFYGGATLDSTMLPPSNEYTRFAFNGNLRGLAMDSTLAGRLTYSTLTNEVTMLQNILSTGATNPATNPSEPTFKGDHKTTTASISLASRPSNALDTKLYWNYNKLKNDSTDVTFDPAVGSGLRGGSTNPIVNCANVAGSICEPEMFHYTKQNLGAEAGYRLPDANKVSGGLDWTHTDRERADFVKTKETKLFGEWKNSTMDWVTGRIKYQYLRRTSDFEANDAVLAANPMDLYVRRFDFANVKQHQLKLAADANPTNLIDVGVEAIWKRNRYSDTPLGRTEDQRQEYYVSLAYGDPKRFRVLTFGDVEWTWYDSSHRVGTGNPDPQAAPTAATYNWTARNKDVAWQLGLGADWVPHTRFTVKSSLIYAETNGRADFTVQPGGSTALFMPVTNFDNTRRLSFTLKGIFDYSRALQLTGGYAFERYRYSDIGYDNTRYVAGAGTSAFYTTGQFAFQPYSATMVYAMAKYKFQ